MVQKAEERHPFSCTIPFCTTAKFEDLGIALYQPARALDDACRSEPGEELAGALKQAILEVVEANYKPYLRSLVILEGLTVDEIVDPSEKLGNLIGQAAASVRRLGEEYTTLVDVRVARIRNACAHQGNHYWIYDPALDAIHVRDAGKEVGTFTPESLLEWVVDLHRLSGHCHYNLINYYLQYYIQHRTGMGEHVVDAVMCLLRGDTAGAEAFNSKAGAAPMEATGRFMPSHGVPLTHRVKSTR